jgi:poly-gamma-glutamate synthase PgsB/CapB
LTQDETAFDRWFGYDAVVERFHRRFGESEQWMEFSLTVLGRLSAQLIGAAEAAGGPQLSIWQQLEWTRIYEICNSSPHNFRVTVALHQALRTAVEGLDKIPRNGVLDRATLRSVSGLSLDRSQHVWVQASALALLAIEAPREFLWTAGIRLSDPQPGDDFFVRRRIVELLACPPQPAVEGVNLVLGAAGDASPFVRQAVARSLASHPLTEASRAALRRLMTTDPEPSVRAATVVEAGLAGLSGRSGDVGLGERSGHLERVGFAERVGPDVRPVAGPGDDPGWLVECLQNVLGHESDAFVIRAALCVIAERVERLAGEAGEAGEPSAERIRAAATFGDALMNPIRQLQERAPSLPVRRWAAQSAERIWTTLNPEARKVRQLLEQRVGRRDPRRTVRLPRSLLRRHDEKLVGRVLSVLAQEDYGFDVERGWWSPVARRMPLMRFRLWRLWHELRHPSPDKRQAFSHVVGRVSNANLRVPSGIMGELSPTKVPGEPLHLPDDQSWRPYLPLVDDVLSSLNQWLVVSPVRFFTADGVTSLKPPRFWPWRLRAWSKLTFGFQKYAALRNWTEGTEEPPHGYVNALRKLGFQIEFQPHFDAGLPAAVDRSVLRFFDKPGSNNAISGHTGTSGGDRTPRSQPATADDPAPARVPAPFHVAAPVQVSTTVHVPTADRAATGGPAGTAHAPATSTMHSPVWPAVALPHFAESALRSFDDYSRYFMSVYENSVTQLLVFVGIVFTLFFLRQYGLTRAVRRARKSLCLTVGGWGTRGKSGTERLKAALFNALGFGLVSKSTGCEAMFLHGSTYGELRELILYRPYDKATIWEHSAVLGMAGRLGVPVFLWECMGLNPAYVNVLQQQWSRDDLSTITNAYPDHEDIQGPAGINVAEAISSFIPVRATLFTTESQMYPVLHHQARRMGTEIHRAGWLESGLLTPDVLARFPYNEHPDNIALVVMMAGALGCRADFALKEMADRLVPDLGVLRTFPPASIRTRRLEFSNGMSANERHGTLNNWTRLGFDRHDPAQEPGTWITTVVNNRADRIARSRVFAAMLVNDLPADRHFLIGGNLKGLCGYIGEAWQKWVVTITLQPRDDVNPNFYALTILRKMAKRLRVPTDDVQVRQLLEVMLTGIAGTVSGLALDDLLTELMPLWNSPDEIASRLASHGVDEALIRDLKLALQNATQGWNEFREFAERLKTSTPDELRQRASSLDNELRGLLWRWFERKLVVVEDYHASGEQIIDLIATHTPPGVRNRIMGIQNIKGTGLDFVYRWMAWKGCSDMCDELRSSDNDVFRRALRLLGDFREFGQLSEARVREALEEFRVSPQAQREEIVTQLDLIQANFEAGMGRVVQELRNQRQNSSRFDRLYRWLEEFMDATDAVRRRKAADRIYRDLADERIASERAVLELRSLSQRQKGGWLR